jgi:two-component system OmpR family response regulator
METINKPLSVFLVDDDKMFLLSLKHKLIEQFKNIKFSIFSTGEECLRKMDEKPDIIVLDYYLNSEVRDAMDGIQVLKKIHAISEDIKVIMLSAQDKLDVAVESIKYGAYEYVVKSETAFVRLQNAIKNLLNDVAFNRETKQYEVWNYVVGIAFILLLLLDLWYYLNHS